MQAPLWQRSQWQVRLPVQSPPPATAATLHVPCASARPQRTYHRHLNGMQLLPAASPIVHTCVYPSKLILCTLAYVSYNICAQHTQEYILYHCWNSPGHVELKHALVPVAQIATANHCIQADWQMSWRIHGQVPHVASSGQKLPCRTRNRSRLGPCDAARRRRASASRSRACPNRVKSRI